MPELQTAGYLPAAVWASEFSHANGDTELARGEAIFRSQCMACHTRSGYRGLDRLMGVRDLDATVGFLKMLRSTNPAENAYIAFMPPFVGTEAEGHDLATYLQTLRLPSGP